MLAATVVNSWIPRLTSGNAVPWVKPVAVSPVKIGGPVLLTVASDMDETSEQLLVSR